MNKIYSYLIRNFLVYKKFPDLHIQDYNEHKIVFNLSSDSHSLVVLDDKQWEVFNFIDGKLNVASIVKKLQRKIPQDYIIDTLKYLTHRNIIQIFNFKNKPSDQLFPLSDVGLEITNKCNLACDYCFIDKQNNNKSLDFENGKKYLERIFQLQKKRKIKKFNIRLAGGEPLINFDNMVKLVKFANNTCQKYNIEKLTYSLVTNGTLLDDKKATVLKELNIDTALSFDGLEESCISRKYIDGSNAFNDIIKAYNNLRSKDVNFSVNIVINPLNIKGLTKFIEFLAKDQISFSLLLMTYNPDTNIDFSVFIKDMRDVFSFIRKNMEKYPVFNDCKLLGNIDVKRARLYNCSMESGGSISLNAEGYCEDCIQDAPYGHIFDKNISKKIKNVKRKYNVSVERKENCKDCKWKYVCAGGCALSTLNKYKTVYRESPLCEFIKEMIPELLKIEAEKDLIQRKQGLMC